MQFSRFALIFLAVSSVLTLNAQDKPAAQTEPAKAEAPAAQDQSSTDQSAANPPSGVAVDAVKVTGTTFESPYFKFTYELPAGWKTLNDAARTEANRQAIQEDIERAKMAGVAPKKASAKTPAKDKQRAAESHAATFAGRARTLQPAGRFARRTRFTSQPGSAANQYLGASPHSAPGHGDGHASFSFQGSTTKSWFIRRKSTLPGASSCALSWSMRRKISRPLHHRDRRLPGRIRFSGGIRAGNGRVLEHHQEHQVQ